MAATANMGDSVTQELSAREQSQLEDALYAVLTLIAGADGAIDAVETQRFTQILERVASGDDALLTQIAGAAIAGSAAHAQQPRLDATAASDLVRAAVALADARMSSDAASRFKRGLYLLGTQIAQASGGGMLGLRSRTSDEERRALDALAQLLGISV